MTERCSKPWPLARDFEKPEDFAKTCKLVDRHETLATAKASRLAFSTHLLLWL